jgi:hypothetical protein
MDFTLLGLEDKNLGFVKTKIPPSVCITYFEIWLIFQMLLLHKYILILTQ